MPRPLISRPAPTGLAFEIGDLVLLKGWADFHGLQMVVELDHWVEGDEYEEVIAFYANKNRLRRWILVAFGRGSRCAAADRPQSPLRLRGGCDREPGSREGLNEPLSFDTIR